MNAISKRLLSFVIVLAMVLAMTPVIPFTAAAATTDDIDSWITAFEAAEAAGDVSTITTCPFCSGTEVTWTAKSGAVNGNQTANKFSGHYYLSGDYSAVASSRAIWLAGNSCCYLNGYSVSNVTDAGYSLVSTGGYTLNIFGDGEVTNIGPSWMFDFNGSGLVNIYGGTYTHNGTTADRLMFENNALSGVTTHAMIYGGKFNVNVGSFDEDNSYTNNNVQIADGMEVTNRLLLTGRAGIDLRCIVFANSWDHNREFSKLDLLQFDGRTETNADYTVHTVGEEEIIAAIRDHAEANLLRGTRKIRNIVLSGENEKICAEIFTEE